MQEVYLVGDDERLAAEVRKTLIRERLDCPLSNVFNFTVASERLIRRPIPLIIVILPGQPEHALNMIELISRWPRRTTDRIVAIGPTADPKVVIKALRVAVDDYIDLANLDTELAQTLARWSSVASLRDKPGYLIEVVSPSGGCGSSTVAVNIATLLAQQNKTAMVVDLKLDSGDLAALFDLKPEFSISDLSLNLDRIDRELFERVFTTHSSGVRLLAAPKDNEERVNVNPESIRQILSLMQSFYPYIVVDLERDYGEDQAKLYRAADLLLVVIRLDFTCLRNARRLLRHLDRVGVPRSQIQVVANRYGQPKEVPIPLAEEALEMKILHLIPDDPRTVNRANNGGVPLVIEASSSKVAKSLSKIVTSFDSHQKELPP